jgi:hypothetical protein
MVAGEVQGMIYCLLYLRVVLDDRICTLLS